MSGLVAYESCHTLSTGGVGDTSRPRTTGIDMASTSSVSPPFLLILSSFASEKLIGQDDHLPPHRYPTERLCRNMESPSSAGTVVP